MRVHVPQDADDDVVLRYVGDGEPHGARAGRPRDGDRDWWRAPLPCCEPGRPVPLAARRRRRRLRLAERDWARRPRAFPTRTTSSLASATGPRGTSASVVYEIFPDRFAASGLGRRAARTGPSRASGTSCRPGRGPNTPFEWFGGDLRGVEQHLDHVDVARRGRHLPHADLPGRAARTATTPRRSTASILCSAATRLSARCVDAAHARGMHVLGDLTTNHTGDKHDWFLTRAGTPTSRSAASTLRRVAPGRLRVLGRRPSRCRSSTGARTSCGAGWPRSPAGGSSAGLDGWRIDVANMTGRYREHRRQRARPRRAHPRARSTPTTLLVAEHFHDYRRDLRAGWHGAMNYAGFLRPVWGWLRADESRRARPLVLGHARRHARVRAALRWSPRCGRSGRVCRGSRRCTRGRSSTATTAPASAPSPARASGCSSASASR